MHSPTEPINRARLLALGALPAAAVLALLLVVATRRGAEPDAPALPKRAPAAAADAPLPRIAVAAPRPKPAPDSLIAQKTDEARIHTTLMNYRTAVATGNDDLRKILEPVLRRDRDVALRMAREELSRATEPMDQTIARQMVEALRN